MDTNSSEVTEQPIVTNSSADRPLNQSTSNQTADNTVCNVVSSVAKPEVKEKAVKYKTIESRYKQSTQNWVNKRAEDSHNSSQGVSVRPPSRNPTPERKKTTAKSSTPLSTDKSLNVSGISVINKVNENKDKNPSKTEIKKYSKPLCGRKSIAPKRLPFDYDSNTGKSGPLTVTGLENS